MGLSTSFGIINPHQLENRTETAKCADIVGKKEWAMPRKWPRPLVVLPSTLLFFGILMVLGGCASEREMIPLGPRAAKWLGDERKLWVSWHGIDKDNPIKGEVVRYLNKNGIVISSEYSRTAMGFHYSKIIADKKYFELHYYIGGLCL